MSSALSRLMAVFLLASIAKANENCRKLTFLEEIRGKSLKNHFLRSFGTENCELCQIECFIEERCMSYNCGKETCDLNSSDHILHPGDLVEDKLKIYHPTENACQKKQCRNNSTCLNGFTDKGYKCKCPTGFTGDNCEKAPPPPRRTCKQLYADGHKEDKAYELYLNSGKVPVFCHMSDIEGCGSGGFSLVMKINGSKPTFLYDSALWTNEEVHNTKAGATGLDNQETKLPTYWQTPFTKVCLGMKVGEETKFISLNKEAPSLHSLIADGQHRNTSLGRDVWKSLISGSSLQQNCNKEGFNAIIKPDRSKARIGITSNEQNNCESNDSRIGFGTGGYPIKGASCGNAAKWNPDNRKTLIKAFGYILVQ